MPWRAKILVVWLVKRVIKSGIFSGVCGVYAQFKNGGLLGGESGEQGQRKHQAGDCEDYFFHRCFNFWQ